MQNLLFHNIFPEICMKMKGIGPSRSARVLSATLDPPMYRQVDFQDFQSIRVFSLEFSSKR